MDDRQRKHFVISITFLLSFVLLSLMGCHSVDVKSMTPEHINIMNQHPYSVKLDVLGDTKSKHFLGARPKEIPLAMFKSALLSSIEESNVFFSVVNVDPDYLLEITLLDLTQMRTPKKLGMEYSLFSEWKLIETRTGSMKFQKQVYGSFYPPGAQQLGVTGLTVGPEGAARENISNGLRDISQLNLTEERE